MRWIAAAALALALVAPPFGARADDASRLKVAHEVVDVVHAGDNMRAIMPVMTDQMRAMLVQQGTADKALVDLFVARFSKRMDEQIPEFLDLVAQVYAREFSEEDLQNLLGFYRTPTGQHLLAKTAMIGKSMALAGKQWGENIGREVGAEIDKERGANASPKL